MNTLRQRAFHASTAVRGTAFAALCAALLFAGILAGCGLGLSPARNEGVATLSMRLASLGDAVAVGDSSLQSSDAAPSGRAVMPGAGFVYIRTVSVSGEGGLFGPYAVTTGGVLSTTDIPPGDYDVYVLHSGKDLSADTARYSFFGGSYTFKELMTLPDDRFVEFVSDSVDKSALETLLDGMVSFGQSKGVTLVSGTVNRLSLTLVPIDSGGYEFDLSTSPINAVSSAARARHYYRLGGIKVVLPVSKGSLSLTIKGDAASGAVLHGISFFSSSGLPVPVAQGGTTLSSGLTWTIAASAINSIADADGSVELYQYLDYTGTLVCAYDNTLGGVDVSFDGSATADFQGKRVLVAIYDEAAYQRRCDMASWQLVKPIAMGIIPLDASTGDGSATISASLTDGKKYYYSAQVDSGNHYASLSSLAVIDIATIVPYRGDYVTNGVCSMKPFTGGNPISITQADYLQNAEYVYFADSSGAGSGSTPTDPKAFKNAMAAANALPAGETAVIYLVGNVTGLTETTGGFVMADISVRSYGSAPYTIMPPAIMSSVIFNVDSMGFLTLDNVIVDASSVSSASVPLIMNLGALKLGDGCVMSGTSVTGSAMGAGVYSAGTVEAYGATIKNCRTDGTGGALYLASGASCSIDYNTRILNNSASLEAAAIYAPINTQCDIGTAEISGNTSGSSAVIYGFDDGTPNVTYNPASVTFSGNSPSDIEFNVP